MADDCRHLESPAADAFASPFLTGNRYLFTILPLIAVIGNWRRNMRLFPPVNRALSRMMQRRFVATAWPLVSMALNLFNPIPPRRLSPDVTTDKVAVYVHSIEYMLVMGLDAYYLTNGMAAGLREIGHNSAWRDSRGVNTFVVFVTLVFYIRCVRTVLCAVTRRMLYYDALLDRLYLLGVKLALLVAVHSVVGANRGELVESGVLHFVVSPTDVLIITLSGQLRMVLAEWLGLDLDSERRAIQGHAQSVRPVAEQLERNTADEMELGEVVIASGAAAPPRSTKKDGSAGSSSAATTNAATSQSTSSTATVRVNTAPRSSSFMDVGAPQDDLAGSQL
jgi:hypothetical protein